MRKKITILFILCLLNFNTFCFAQIGYLSEIPELKVPEITPVIVSLGLGYLASRSLQDKYLDFRCLTYGATCERDKKLLQEEKRKIFPSVFMCTALSVLSRENSSQKSVFCKFFLLAGVAKAVAEVDNYFLNAWKKPHIIRLVTHVSLLQTVPPPEYFLCFHFKKFPYLIEEFTKEELIKERNTIALLKEQTVVVFNPRTLQKIAEVEAKITSELEKRFLVEALLLDSISFKKI